MRHFVLSLSLAGVIASVAAAQQGGFPLPGGFAQGGAGGAPQSQQPEVEVPPEQLCTVSGVVVDSVTGQSLKNATVTFFQTGGGRRAPLTARTDATGQFSLATLPPGSYRVLATRDGYAQTGSGRVRSDGTARNITLAAAEKLNNVNFKLVPGAVVSGKVVNEDGEPVVEARVSLLRRTFRNGQEVFGMVSRPASTNDLGEYRLHSLPAGKYYLLVSDDSQRGFRRGPVAPPPPTASAKPEQGYPTLYYPGVTTPSQAQLIEVRAGEDLSAMDFTLRPVPMYRVSGVVKDARTGAAVSRMALTINNTDEAVSFAGMRNLSMTDSAGRFTLTSVEPGAYKLVARSAPRSDEQLFGQTSVTVGEGNVSGLELTVQPGGTLKGMIRIESSGQTVVGASGATANPLTGMRVSLRPLNQTGFGMFAMPPPIGQDGSFELTNVQPGDYRLALNLPQGHYLKQVRLGNQEAPNQIIHIPDSFTSGSLDVLLSPNAAAVSGTVTDADQKPADGAMVVIVPEFQQKPELNTDRILITQTDQRGNFQFAGVAPGRYRVLAFADVEADQARDPDFLKPLMDSGEPLDVAEKDQKRVTPKLISVAE